MTNAMRWAASEYVEPVEPEVNWYTVPRLIHLYLCLIIKSAAAGVGAILRE